MGCCLSGGEGKTDHEPLAQSRPMYSWETENRQDRSQLIISGQVGVVTGRLPGQLNGRQFHIQDCQKCQLFILDHTSAVTLHGCSECDVVLGPCAGSVFMRQCTDCTVVVASQQFRARDCRKCNVFLHCKTQPVIESCHKLKFNCYQAFYPELRDQFLSADLHPFHNQWSLLHDFTGQNRGTDRSITQETTPPISPPAEGDLSGCGLSFERGQSTVPYTSGTASRPAEGESCLVAVLGEAREKTAWEFLRKVHGQLVLVQSCHAHFKEQTVQAYFGSHDDLLAKLSQGPCILLDLSGSSCLQVCRASLAGVPEEVCHISSSGEEGGSECEALASYLSGLTM